MRGRFHAGEEEADDSMGNDESAGDSSTPESPVYEVEIPVSALLRLAVVVIATVLVLAALSRAQQLVGVGITAVVLAAVVKPVVDLAGRRIGRTASTVLVHLLLLFAIAGATAAVVQSVRTEAAALESYTAVQLDQLEADGGPTVLTRTRLDDRVGDAVSSWGIGAVVGEDDASGIASRVSELIILIVVSAFLSLQGDALVSTVLGWTDDRDRRRVLREIWNDSGATAASYTRRSMAIGLLSGAGAAAVALAFDLPGVLLIGVGAALLSMIPILGPIAGWSPLVVIVAIDRSPSQLVAMIIIALAASAVVLTFRARLLRVGFRPGSFLVAIGIAAGVSAAGLPGGIVGLFLGVALARAASHDWTVERLTVAPADVSRPPTSSLVRTTIAAPRPAEGEPPGLSDRLLLKASRGTLWRVTGIVVVAFSLQLSITRIGPTLIWAIVGVLIAVGLDRPVSWLERHGVHRVTSVVVGGVLATAFVVGLGATASGSLGDSAAFDTDVADAAQSFEDLPLVGDRLADWDIQTRLEDLQRDVPRLMSDSTIADRVVAVLGGGMVGAFWILVVAMACLMDGPRLVAAIDRRVPARFRRQTTRLSRAGHSALSGYVAGSALVAALNGLIVGLLGVAVGVPAPAVLAIWAFSWNFVPQIGAVVGWAPFLVLAFLVGPVAGLGCLAFFLLYQVVENNLIQPSIVGHAVDISPLAALTAALVGVTVAGLVGAVLAIPLAGVCRALVTEWRREDFPSIDATVTGGDSASGIPSTHGNDHHLP